MDTNSVGQNSNEQALEHNILKYPKNQKKRRKNHKKFFVINDITTSFKNYSFKR